MQSYIRRGVAVAFTVVGLAACADPFAPPEPRAAGSPPAFSISGSTIGTVLCTPCPPGMMCAQVCEPSSPQVEVLPSVEDDTEDVTIVAAPAWASKTW